MIEHEEISAADPWKTDWRRRAPRSLLTRTAPQGQLTTATLDRRWLWRIQTFLAFNAGPGSYRELSLDLTAYLHESCTHDWEYGLGCCDEPMRQCLWCNVVETVAAFAQSSSGRTGRDDGDAPGDS